MTHRSASQGTARIPVYLLTGFLGSGKTTVLNQLVKQADMARTLVIINEFGAVSLDHLLVSHANEDIVVELGSGCLCCTIRGDLAKTLHDASWRYARNGVRQFDRVMIETTGLADPAPVLHTLLTDRSIFSQYRLQGVVTTIDAVNATSHAGPPPGGAKTSRLSGFVVADQNRSGSGCSNRSRVVITTLKAKVKADESASPTVADTRWRAGSR